MKKLCLYLLCSWLITSVICLAGCSGTGLDKRATLMPDSVSIGYQQEQYRGDSRAWKGWNVGATWNFD